MRVDVSNNNLWSLIADSVADDYDDSATNDTDVNAGITTDLNIADVWVVQAPASQFGATEVGYGECHSTSTRGENLLNRWCKPFVVFFNEKYKADWNNNTALAKWIVCHELGHTLGLRHSQFLHPNVNSCMETGNTVYAGKITSADRPHLRNCLPIPRTTPDSNPSCR
jgi:hypothetical protein